jgi:hypothetical protein
VIDARRRASGTFADRPRAHRREQQPAQGPGQAPFVRRHHVAVAAVNDEI